MSFKWDHYLEIAESLCEQGIKASEGEGWFRCAISRAYYAAFHESLIYLKDITLEHVEVARTLEDRPSRKDRSLFGWFDFMRRNRRMADYDSSVEVVAEDAEKVIDSARRFIKLARN